jgi:hypothetical protein
MGGRKEGSRKGGMWEEDEGMRVCGVVGEKEKETERERSKEQCYHILTFSLGGDLLFFVVRNSFRKISLVSLIATESEMKRKMKGGRRNEGRGMKREGK